uniref:DNA-directed RNA polymerase subunit alpha n=1 Tax=Koliella corcontica TaxID=155904 RepID=A0A097KMV9_9CHLO|nr:alpha subunit of RNA polymerase [Koliella corcontica]AIT94517.1 alpha subunit of RNA polymerase [Koliella corcontica]
MKTFVLSRIESKIENKTKFYGRYLIGPFNSGQGLTIANALRRTLLSEIKGVAITAIEIEGVNHEYSTIWGLRESILDLMINLKKIIISCKFNSDINQLGFIKVQGPAIIRAKDIKLPLSYFSIDPNQYIGTISHDMIFTMKCIISQKNYFALNKNKLNLKNKISFNAKTLISQNFIPLDSIFNSIKKVNYLIEKDNKFKPTYKNINENIVLEIWTNGAINPTQALNEASNKLTNIFDTLKQNNPIIYKKTHQKSKIKNIKKIYKINEKLANQNIGYLELSIRPYICLKRAKINKIGDLVSWSKEDLLNLKNLSKLSLKEIELNLNQKGLKLKSLAS